MRIQCCCFFVCAVLCVVCRVSSIRAVLVRALRLPLCVYIFRVYGIIFISIYVCLYIRICTRAEHYN